MIPKKLLLSCKEINTAEKYFDNIKNLKKPKITHLTEYKNYENFVESSAKLDKNFLDKKFVGDEYLAIKYNIKSIAGEGDTFTRAVKVMQWLTDNTYYYGMQYKNIYDDSYKILKHALKNEFKNAINCRLKAILLADILLSIGIVALPICMQGTAKNIENNKMELGCHFMVHVYLNETKKWVVFDPSFNTYFKKDGKVLNIIELRQSLSEGVFPEIIGYNFNRKSDECIEEYKLHFVCFCLEFLFTWSTNVRKKKFSQGFSCQFNYGLQPKNDIWYDRLVEINGIDYAKKITKNIVYIGIDDFLLCK